MRVAIGVLTFLTVSVWGPAVLAQWPVWGGEGVPMAPQAHPWAHASRSSTGCCDDSPLCPELASWVVQHSQCKRPACSERRRHCSSDINPDVFALPPLPYSFSAFRANPAGPATVSTPPAASGGGTVPNRPAPPPATQNRSTPAAPPPASAPANTNPGVFP